MAQPKPQSETGATADLEEIYGPADDSDDIYAGLTANTSECALAFPPLFHTLLVGIHAQAGCVCV